MMSAPNIQVDSLSKRYLISHQAGGRDGLRHSLENAIRNPFQWLRRRNQILRDSREEYWALKDVSFEVEPGDVVGIVGRNGAGKSTLLKILSRITEPTNGRITLQGRVASLLEVGTGFHPELTGRENIFLNGAILGMTRSEIKAKFDEIVAFSEVEKFLDTPVKRYSSGMYVRLAFAVAAHLEPEILIIDEVLAVGDASFQQKCLGKMGEVAKSGRTVLFVSHNMATVTALCRRAICLSHGTLIYDGIAEETVSRFIRSFSDERSGTSRDLETVKSRKGNGAARITRVELYAAAGEEVLALPRMGDTLGVRYTIQNNTGISGAMLRSSLSIRTITGQRVVHVSNEDDGFELTDSTEQTVSVELPSLQLYPGVYTVSLWVGSPRYNDYDYVEECLSFEVGPAARSPRAFKTDWSQGLFLHKSVWRLSCELPV